MCARDVAATPKQKSRPAWTGSAPKTRLGSAFVARKGRVDRLARELRVGRQAVVKGNDNLALDQRRGIPEELEVQADAILVDPFLGQAFRAGNDVAERRKAGLA